MGDAQHFQHGPPGLGECAAFVLLPVPVGCQLGQAAVAGFAFTQLGGAFANGFLEHLVLQGELPVQKSNFQHVVNPDVHLGQIERFTDEVLCAGFQRAHLVTWLSRQHDDRKVRIGTVGLERFHDLEAVHAGHVQIEQDQVIVVLAVQRANVHRIRA